MSKWISVKDKLPKIEEKILICERHTVHLVEARQDGMCYGEDGWAYDIKNFDYWMPVPEPPEEIESDDLRGKLTTRTARTLRMQGIETVDDLKALDDLSIKKLRNIGRKAYEEIKSFLEELNE